jgi:hypothetical protein
LRLDAGYFAPATVNATYDYVEDSATADKNPFAQDHSTRYESLGRITGYYERADWNPAGGAVTFRYQASVFGDSATAKVARQDNVTHQQSAFAAQLSPCPNGNPPPTSFPDCTYIATQDTQQATWFTDYAWAAGYCLIETEAQFPKSMDSATVTQIEQTLSNFTYQGYVVAGKLCSESSGAPPTPTNTVVAPPSPTTTRTPTPTPVTTSSPTPTPTHTVVSGTSLTQTPTPIPSATPTSTKLTDAAVRLLAVRLDKRELKDDLSRPSLARVKVHQTTLLSIFVNVLAGAVPKRELDFNFSVKRGKTEVLSKRLPEQIPDTRPQQVRETTTAQFSKKGKYTFTGTIAYLGQSEQQSTTFTVIAAAKKACATIAGQQYCTKP